MRVGMGTVFQNPHDRRPDREVYAYELRLDGRCAYDGEFVKQPRTPIQPKPFGSPSSS